MKCSSLDFISLVNELWTLMTCWGKLISAVETLIVQLHEVWDVKSFLFALKIVVQRKEWSQSLETVRYEYVYRYTPTVW